MTRHVAVIGSVLAAAPVAWAQQAPVEVADLQTLGTVYVTDSRGAARDEVPAAVALVPSGEIERISALRVSDVLAAVPGVFLSGLNGPREIVQIRGPLAFDNRTLFLEDGVPLQSPIYYDQSALGYSQALSSPGGIEVLRGPGTALYGSDALTGVVHVRTRDPDDPLRLGARLRGGQYGLFDLQAEAGGPLPSLGAGHAARATLAASGEDGFRDETAFHRSQGVLRHRFEGDGLRVDSGLYLTDYETESATAIPYDALETGDGASGLNPAVDVDEAVETGTLIRAQSRVRLDLAGAWSIEATPYLRRQDSAATAVFQPATTPRETARLDTFGLLPRIRHEQGGALTTFGMDLELTELDLRLVQSRPDTVVFGDLFRQGPQFDYTVDYRAVSPFVQHERTLGEVTLQLGLRYDALRYTFDNALEEVPGDARLQVPDRVDEFDALTPKAGLIWDYDEAQSVFLRYARGFRVPRAAELYELEAGQAQFELEPETLDSVELGWRHQGARLDAEIVAYWQESQDGVLTDVQTAAGNISVNGGSQRFAGVEGALSARLVEGLDLQAVLAWQEAVYKDRSAREDDPFDGNAIAETPRTLGQVVLTWTPPALDRLSLSGRLRHIGAWPLNDANTLYTDDEWLIGLNVDWQMSEHLVADLRVENVLDESYAVFADAPVFAPDGRVRPGQPRTISAGLRVRY